MALGGFISGYYGVTFGGESLGVTEVGFETVCRPSFVPVRTDETGRTPVDGIWTGVEDLIVRAEGLQWTTVLWQKILVWAGGASEGTILASGKMISTLIFPLVLTPAIVTNPVMPTYTYTRAYMLEPIRSVFSSQRLRTVPMGFYIFAASITALVQTQAVVYSVTY
jgi:hypothetical protein